MSVASFILLGTIKAEISANYRFALQSQDADIMALIAFGRGLGFRIG